MGYEKENIYDHDNEWGALQGGMKEKEMKHLILMVLTMLKL